MDGSVAQTYLSDILHAVSQSLLAPDIILLLVLVAYALFSIGSVIAEFFTERRHFKVVMPEFLADLTDAQEQDVVRVIDESGLLKRQKKALQTVFEYRSLPGDALIALVKRLMNEEESRYDRISGIDGMAARIAPMLGLMGTLIPLGPGIQALGQADTAALSSSLLVAFDTTVAGLVVAAACLVVGKVRSVWYDNYLSALDSAMATMLQKVEDSRAGASAVAAQATVPARVPAVAQDYPDAIAQSVPQAASQPVLQAVPQPVAQPMPQPMAQPVAQPVPQHMMQPPISVATNQEVDSLLQFMSQADDPGVLAGGFAPSSGAGSASASMSSQVGGASAVQPYAVETAETPLAATPGVPIQPVIDPEPSLQVSYGQAAGSALGGDPAQQG